MTAEKLTEPWPRDTAAPPARRLRLAYLVSHPIQYQAPLLRLIAREPSLDLTVLYGSDFSARSYRDEGFATDVLWDQPLLTGYTHEFLPALRDAGTEGIFTPVSRSLMARLRHGRFDALWVHGYATVNQLQAIVAAWLLGIPVLLRSDSTLRDRPRGRLKRVAKSIFFATIRPMIAGVLVSGSWNRAYWQKMLGPGTPLTLLPYAVDNDWFQQQSQMADTATLRAQLGLEPGRLIILFASKLQTRKHCDDLIEAYRRYLADSAPQPEPYLLIAGDGEERSRLERQAAGTGLQGIRFCGFQNESRLPGLFALADVFVLPARHEPWGLVVNEAMNAGCPVILSDDVGCHPDLVTNGIEGFVYPVRDLPALATALRTILEDPEWRADMREAALARIRRWSFQQDLDGLLTALAALRRPEGDR
jgi:glycosyltransferase involved in cell wall biosynthesis